MKKIFLLLMALIAATTVWAEDYITDVMVIGGSKSETNALKTTYTNQGWTVIDQDLNAGASGDYIFLLYKKASETAGGASFITDFYLSSASGTVPDNIEHNGRTYHLAACDGSDYFKNSKGDLNCHCSGSAYIHLYYTKEYPDNGQDYSTVKTISINNTQAGAVGENGGTTGYDLNTGAGGDYIYMHADKSQGWIVSNGVSTNDCIITGFDGPKPVFTTITIPVSINGKVLEGFSSMNFGGFTNLETMTFLENTIISQMPSMQGCSKFKHVNTGSVNDQTPLSMTSISAYAFAGTAIETINMPSVTSIGEHAFEDCGIKQATLSSFLMEIGTYAFYNCNSLTDIYFDGTQQQWGNVIKGENWKPAATTEHWRCTVTFDANGHGTTPETQTVWSNQDKVTEPSMYAFGYKLLGWYTEAACTNQWDFNTVVTSDMTLYAKWEVSQYDFNSETGVLTLLWGEFNAANKWGSDVPASAVKSVTATSDVSFTGDCTELFDNFTNCTSMDLKNVNTSNVTEMRYMFRGCSSLTSLDISGWNTSNVTRMDYMFRGCSSLTMLDLSNWNTSNVTNMFGMFEFCSGLTTLELSGWNTGNVIDMSHMFRNCQKLTSLDVSNWNTSNVLCMYGVFWDCNSLTTLDLSGWNTGNVRYMDNMFRSCSSLTSLDLSGWNTGNVIYMDEMFRSCSSLTTIYAGLEWSTEKVADSGYMFKNCTSLVGGMGTTYNANHTNKEYARIDGGPDSPGYFSSKLPRYTYDSTTGALTLNWGVFNSTDKWGEDVPTSAVKSVTATRAVSFTGDCAELFDNFTNCTSMDLKNVNTSNVTIMRQMFDYCKSLTSLDLSGWNTANVTDMRYMFELCSSLTSLNLTGWNTGNVTRMLAMFYYCSSLTSLDLSGWDTGRVHGMANMFTNCSNLTSINLSGWNTDSVTNMTWMFRNCQKLTSLNISNWNTSNVTSMECMFEGCWSLNSLDLSGWDTGKVTDMERMFLDCHNLTTIYVGAGWNTDNVTISDRMFENCTAIVGGMGTAYDPSHIEIEYARIDGGPDCPGYFTDKNATVVVPGDVNGDGSVTSADVTALYNYLLNGDETYLSTSDVDGDGFITTTDITVIYNILLGSR